MQADFQNRPTSARWRRIEDLYHRANEFSEIEREEFLDGACGGDLGLRREVESLLGYASQAEPFMEEPLVEDPRSTGDSGQILEGRELGSYKILSLLGAGGMGKVYLAQDTRLGRTVAIKVLARAKVADVERKRRFMLEARAASALNHPNIVTLYDIASDAGIDFLVMEYVEGESLHSRISPKGLPLEEILAYASQIVSALATAHAAGIVHRDIKPANVMVTPKGVVKVLDFGLAKLAEAGQPPASADSPTEITRTQRGVILGTAAYMSPEQAAGKPVDARADIFAVGVVLYEMLTGRRPFDRGTVLATLGAVMYEEPTPLGGIVKAAPPDLIRIVERCLRKDPDRRIQTMADLKVALEELQEALEAPTVPAEVHDRVRRPRMAWVVAGFAILVAAASILFLIRRDAPSSALLADFKPLTTMNGWEVTPSWSDNGDMIAYSGNRDGNMDIFVMTVAGGEPNKLTDNPWDEVAPRWSPNLAYMAYVADPGTGANVYLKPALSRGGEHVLAETKMTSLDGGFGLAVQVLGSRPWSTNSQELLYSGPTDSGSIAIFRVNVTTRVKDQLTNPAPGESDFNATLSFDGEWIAFDRVQNGKYGMWTIPAAGGKESPVLPFGEKTWGGSTWSADGKKLLYAKLLHDDTRNIWEVEVNSGRAPRPVTSGPSWDQFPIVSRTGRLAYVRFGPHNVDLYKMSFEPDVDRPANAERVTYHSGENFFPSFSQDARRIVYQSDQSGANEIYRIEVDTKGSERNLTADPATDLTPDWSPDGREIVYVSNRGGRPQLSLMDSDGGSRRTLTDLIVPDSASWSSGEIAPRWSPDGKSIAFVAVAERGKTLWRVDRDGNNLKEILAGVRYFEWYDNRHILFVDQSGDGRARIQTVDLLTGVTTLLLPTPAIELDVSRDGTKLLYTSAGTHFGMNLWVQPLRPGLNGMPTLAGKSTQITDGGGDWHAHKGVWSPDGKTIVYTRDSDQGNIYTIENYR